jgi:hypothetical protein
MGKEGLRAVEMLEAAAERLERGGLKAPEIACYCTREAFNSLLLLSDETPSSIRSTAREVLTAASRESDASSETALGRALEQLREVIIDDANRNERRLAAVIGERAGVEPFRFQRDLFSRASRLIRSLNAGLHGISTQNSAQGLYEEALEIIENLFEPITGRLDKVDGLAGQTDVGEDDIQTLEGLCADPRVAEYFFTKPVGLDWFTALQEHPLLQPRSSTGFWPASAYLQRVAEADPTVVDDWMKARLKDGSASSLNAVRYIWLATRIGFPARRAVLTAVHRHPSLEVAQEAAMYVSDIDEAQGADRTIIRITEAALKIISRDG